jgi:hypothetical protein
MRRPVRKGGRRGDASRAEQCADQANTVAATRPGNAGTQNVGFAVLLDWHLNASHGYGVGADGLSCSLQSASAAPIPGAVSEAYEMTVRFRDGRAPGPATNWALQRYTGHKRGPCQSGQLNDPRFRPNAARS